MESSQTLTPVQNKFLTALAKIGRMPYLQSDKTKPKAYVKNNTTRTNCAAFTRRKVQKIGSETRVE